MDKGYNSEKYSSINSDELNFVLDYSGENSKAQNV